MSHRWIAVVTGTAIVAGAVALFSAPILAHEHWIDVQDFYPDTGETIEIYVASGHYFPKSDHILKEDVIDALRVLRGNNEPIVLESVAGEKVRRAELVADRAGVSLLHLTLKRPRAKQPSFEAKAILITGAGDSLFKDDPGAYRTGEGLELIPQAAISSLSPGDKLPIVLALDGKPVAGALEIVPEAGKSSFLSTSAVSPAVVPVRTAGKYLVAAHVSGRGCSLVFEVGPAADPGGNMSGRGGPQEKQE